jgi:hypothetical protein
LPGDSYTDLRARFEEVPLEVPSELPLDVPRETAENPRTSPSGRKRRRTRREETLRVRRADPDALSGARMTTGASGGMEATQGTDALAISRSLTWSEALRQVPAVLRETLELYAFKTRRERVDEGDLAYLHRLGDAHTPAVIQRALTEAVARFVGRGDGPGAVTWAYLWASLQHFTTRAPRGAARPSTPPRRYPPGVTRLE